MTSPLYPSSENNAVTPACEAFINDTINANVSNSYAATDKEPVLMLALTCNTEHQLEKTDSGISMQASALVNKRKSTDVMQRAILKSIKSFEKVFNKQLAVRNAGIEQKLARMNAASRQARVSFVRKPVEAPGRRSRVRFAPGFVSGYSEESEDFHALILATPVPTAATAVTPTAEAFADPKHRQPQTIFQSIAAIGEEIAYVAVRKLAPTCTQPLLRATVRTARAAIEGELATHLREEASRLLAVARDPASSANMTAAYVPNKTAGVTPTETAANARAEPPFGLPMEKEVPNAGICASVMGW
ncbi:hypothetical protein HK101_003775, partial [Irineochytrium annulatum]